MTLRELEKLVVSLLFLGGYSGLPGFWAARCYVWADADLGNFVGSSGTWLEPWVSPSVALSFLSSSL